MSEDTISTENDHVGIPTKKKEEFLLSVNQPPTLDDKKCFFLLCTSVRRRLTCGVHRKRSFYMRYVS